MTASHTCPSCGYNLSSLNGIRHGALSIERGVIYWNAHRIKLTRSENILVQAIAGGDGHAIKLSGLIEAVGSESGDPRNLAAVLVCRIRRKFRQVDADFDAIETVGGYGYRWAVEPVEHDWGDAGRAHNTAREYAGSFQ